MSWYKDPQLFIVRSAIDSQIKIVRIKKEIGKLVLANDFSDIEVLDFSKHLSLGHNKDSDYTAFKESFPQNSLKFVNSQGLVVNWDGQKRSGTWSCEEINSPFYSLPTFQQDLQRKVSALEAENFTLQEEVKMKKEEKQSLDEKVSKLESKYITLHDNVKMAKEEKQTLDKKVSELQEKISIMHDEIKRNKEEKQLVDKRVSELEAENLVLQEKIKGNDEEKQIISMRVYEVGAENATLQDEIKKIQNEKQSLDKRVFESGSENLILHNKIQQDSEEKELMNQKISELEAENSKLQDEVKREKDKKQKIAEKQEKRYTDLKAAVIHLYDKKAREDTITTLEDGIAILYERKKELTEDINTSKNEITKLDEQLERVKENKQALEKQVSELTSKLRECSGVISGSTNDNLWITGRQLLKYWVPFEELDVQTFPNDAYSTVFNGSITPISEEENTTNICTSHVNF